jgi:hypothetical protein
LFFTFLFTFQSAAARGPLPRTRVNGASASETSALSQMPVLTFDSQVRVNLPAVACRVVTPPQIFCIVIAEKVKKTKKLLVPHAVYMITLNCMTRLNTRPDMD